jgi:membrane protein
MASLKERLTKVRERRPVLDHLLLMQEHYSEVKAGQQAGAVTYFGFLSFFPIMALAFFTVGYVSRVYPDAQDALVDAINTVLPGIVGNGDNELSLTDIEDAAGAVGLIGLAGVLYSGLGWLSAMRDALFVVFEKPAFEQPSFVIGKLRDLVTLAIVGVVLLLSVGISGGVTGFSEELLDMVGLGAELGWLLTLLGVVVGLLASTVLFYAMFRLLGAPDVPGRSLWSGAVFGAIGFEVLKQLSSLLLGLTEGQPAFQAFGIALILLVWINYFSRVVVLSAAWAHTSPEARALRGANRVADQMPEGPRIDLAAAAPGVRSASLASDATSPKAAFAAGAAAMLGLVALLRRRS